MRRMLSLLLLALSGSSTAACLIDAVTVPDSPLFYVSLRPVSETRSVTVRVTCDRAQDRYGLLLSGSVQVGPGGWEAELQPRRGPGAPLRIVLEGAAEVFGPGVSFGGVLAGGNPASVEGPRSYIHTLTLRPWAGQWVAGGDYVSDLRVSVFDL